MGKLREHVVEILNELKLIQSEGVFTKGQTGIPGLIAAGNQKSILVNDKIEKEIRVIARILLQNEPDAARQFTLSEWRTLVRRAFGPALAPVDLDEDLNMSSDAILSALRTEVKSARTNHGLIEYSVGCTLFGNTDVEPIVIGPVRIAARSDWLKDSVKAGNVSKITARRLNSLWNSNSKPRKT